MRTVYLGTSAFAAVVLRRLAESPHRPALVITRPDSPQGRGRRLRPPPAADTAAELGLELYQPESINSDETRGRIASVQPQAICVCAFGALIKEPLLSEHLMLNVHPSLLPRWRGAAPIERALLGGDDGTGVSIMVVTAGLDSGPVCRQAEEPIRPDDDYGSLSTRLQTLGGELLVRTLDDTEARPGAPDCAEQDDAQATYAEKITAEDRRLDPREDGPSLVRRVRALTPHIGAYLEAPETGADRLGVMRAEPAQTSGVAPGELKLDGPRPLFGCAGGAIELVVVQPPGRRPMPGEDYLRGLHR